MQNIIKSIFCAFKGKQSTILSGQELNIDLTVLIGIYGAVSIFMIHSMDTEG